MVDDAPAGRVRILGERRRGRLGVRKKPKRSLTRKDFLRAGGASVAGVSLLGAAGCASFTEDLTHLPEEYLPSGGPGMNVVLVILDSLRKDRVGAYGNDWTWAPTATTG
jgi:hypothetical protein